MKDPSLLWTREVIDLGWKVRHYVTGGAAFSTSMLPSDPGQAGLFTSAFYKDPSDPLWIDDSAVKTYRTFMAKYFSSGNPDDSFNAYAYTVSNVMRHVLEQCKGDFRRETIMREANSIVNLDVPLLLPGIRVNVGPTNHHPIRQLQLKRWDGKRWTAFGDVIRDSHI